MKAPRIYTISVVRDHWNNHVMPQLMMEINKQLSANVTSYINRVSGFEEDLVQMLEPPSDMEGANAADTKGKDIDVSK
jgi:hypothetical protein